MLFETGLTLLTLALFVIWVLDLIFWKKKRRMIITKKKSFLVEFTHSYLPIFATVLIIRSFLFEPFRIPSGSMLPTLLVGDFIVASKYSYGLKLPVLRNKIFSIADPARGDVVVFQEKGTSRYLIKRIVGIPGDKVEYKGEELYINGVKLEHTQTAIDNSNLFSIVESTEIMPVNENKTIQHQIYHYPHRTNKMNYVYTDLTVPAGSYFMMGDNRNDSEDSRFWGVIPEQNFVGKAMFTWLSVDLSNLNIRFSRFGKKVI